MRLSCRYKQGVLVLLALLAGCSNSPGSHLSDYQARLSRTLQQSVQPALIQRVPPLPVQQNRMPLPQAEINLLELLRLDQCRIGLVVAQKNSSLGRVALPSQQLSLELDLLTHGPECVTVLRHQGDHALADRLHGALQQKHAARLSYWWNAWPGSEEWQRFSGSYRALDWQDQQPAHLSQTVHALDYALQLGQLLQDGDYPAAQALAIRQEQHLQQLQLGRTLGRWLSSAYTLIPALQHSADMLEQRLAAGGLCPAGKPTATAQILQNVFVKYYVGEVQPYLAVTDRTGREVLPRLEQMVLLMPEAPAGFLNWLAELQRIRTELAQANQRHVQAWQAQLRQCGMMPGQSPDG